MASHYSDYDPATTQMCERVLVTLLGDIGPWSKWVTLVGGLAPRYIVGALPRGVQHVGTNDIDVVLQIALSDIEAEGYRTLATNLGKAGFTPGESSYQWMRKIEQYEIVLEFLCDTDRVEPGRIFKPKDQKAGSGLGAVNIPGASLAIADAKIHRLKAERVDGGSSEVELRVTNLLPFIVLKIQAFQDRHEPKDVYDLVFCLIQHSDGPRGAARTCATSPVRHDKRVEAALALLGERFVSVDTDGPYGYAAFLGEGDDEQANRLRQDAYAAVSQFRDNL